MVIYDQRSYVTIFLGILDEVWMAFRLEERMGGMAYAHYLFALRLSSICPNRFVFVFFLLALLLWCFLAFLLYFSLTFIFFSFVAHFIPLFIEKGNSSVSSPYKFSLYCIC